jgi:CBS domain-containing protein
MLAKDVMTTGVVTIEPETTVREIATVLADRGISAVPVVDKGGAILGIVSEGDLIHRQEIGTDKKKSSWWLLSLSKAEEAAVDYSKSHGMHAHDIMTRDVVTVSESTSLNEIADTLETKRIKRVPVVRDGVLVGIVSRANIVQAIAARPKGAHAPVSGDDRSIRGRVTDNLKDQPWSRPWNNSVFVSDSVVDIYGTVDNNAERDASRIAAENTPGVVKVIDHRGIDKYSVGGI